MVAQVSKFTKNGQITIPPELRDELGLEEGEPIVIERIEDTIVIRRATVTEQTAGMGAPWRKVPPLTREEEEDALARAIGEAGAQYE